HPLIDELVRETGSQPVGAGWRAGATLRLALMPGSRRHEIEALLPPMLEAVSILKREGEVDAFVI
ncbi:MAG TPA: lipid-A-disaccharide synthase, partial [Thermoanaerobaculia bacterium]